MIARMAEGTIYRSERLARAYAHDRPPVHARVIALIEDALRAQGWPPLERPPRLRALDVGCGAGLSTAALARLAGRRVGLEPAAAMLAHRRHVDPAARFVVGRAEHLPFTAGRFDLLTAAGSLNYADLGRFLPEAGRVLTDVGLLVVYDFSSGRRLPGDEHLAHWFEAFEARYPFPAGYALDVRSVPFGRAGLQLTTHRTFEVRVPMTLEAYIAYAMSETNVEAALLAGQTEDAISRWCRSTLEPFFPVPHGEVLFQGYFAIVERA